MSAVEGLLSSRRRHDIGSNELRKRRFEASVKAYFKALTEGCGDENCNNPFCKSGKGKNVMVQPDEAAAVAIKLAVEGVHQSCVQEAKEKPTLTKAAIRNGARQHDDGTIVWEPTAHARPIELEDLRVWKHRINSTHEEEKRSVIIEECAGTVLKVFSDHEAFSRSFLGQKWRKTYAGEKISVILSAEPTVEEVEELERSYTCLYAMNSARINDAILEGTEVLLQYLDFHMKAHPDEVLRSVVKIMENPMCLDPEYHKFVVKKVAAMITSLPEKSQHTLIQWWMRIGKPRFTRSLTMLQHFITLRIYTTQRIDDAIVSATRALDLLYHANENIHEHKQRVDFSEFYNDAVNQEVNLKEDYYRWKSPHRYDFSFCCYPFILDPASKGKILQFDAQVQMNREFEDAILRSLFVAPVSPFLIVRVRREYLIQDTLQQISKKHQDLKKQLKVQFVGEEGIDEGGVQKEFFQLIVKQIFDPRYGMFLYNDEMRQFWFNGQSLENETEFELIGIVLGIAIYNGIILDVQFPMVLYKKLMQQRPTLNDLEEFDPVLGRSLRQLLDFDGDVADVFCQTFEISVEMFGEMQAVSLLENGKGAEKEVTNDNREEYVALYVEYILEKGVEKQFGAFSRGFHMVCGGPTLQLFRPEELQLLLCGNPTLDFNELEKAAIYDDGYTDEHWIIQAMWRVIKAFDNNQKKKFLFFCTGCDRAPIKGLSQLQFVVTRAGPDSDRLPTAHTCFNHLLLPEYSSEEKLRDRLLVAISNAEGFGLI